MPTESPPEGQRSRTAKAARAQSDTDGVKEGALASISRASGRASSGAGARYAPRFAASMAPGPPPVATVSPDRVRARPSSAAPRYSVPPRDMAWPPITPTTRAPARCSSRASETASSCTERSIEEKTSPSDLVSWNQAYARASGVASYPFGSHEKSSSGL